MHSVSNFGRLGLAIVLAFGSGVRADSPLDIIPADAKIVVLLNNLERTMQGTERFANAIGVPAPAQDLSQMTVFLGEVGSHWKMTRGVGVAVMELSPDGFVSVFPMDDGPAALKAVKPEMKGEFGAFDLQGQPVVGLAKPKHLLISHGETALKAFTGEKNVAASLTPVQAKLAESSAAFIYVNIQALKPVIEQGVAEPEQLKRMIERMAGGNPQVNPEQVAKIVTQAVLALSKEAKSIYFAFQIDEKAAGLKIGVEFLPESKARSRFAAYKPAKRDLFATLPPTNFIAAFGVDVAGLANLDGTQEGPKVNGFSGAFGFENGLASLLFRIDTPDAAALYLPIKGGLGVGQLYAQGASKGKVEFANSEKKVGGSDVAQTVVKIKDVNPKAQAVMKDVVGGPDFIIQHGVVGQAIGLAVGGKGDPFAALQAGGSLGASDRMRAATAMLPANAAFALLVDPVSFFQFAKKGARAAGDETPIATATVSDKPGVPMAAALSIESDGLMLHIHVPSAAVKDVAPILQQIN
jgi:hypothetical protein